MPGLRGGWAIATVFVAGLVLYESTRGSGDPTLPDTSTEVAYIGHFLAYAALAFCARMATYRRSLADVPIIVGVATLYGGLIEVYQSTLAGREASVLDALTNLLGAAAGVGAAAFVIPRWEYRLPWRRRQG